MSTLAQFDAETQTRATAVFNMFTAQYRVSPNIIRPEEVGSAVKRALDVAGGDEAKFGEELWSSLLSYLHQRMAAHAAQGIDLPSGLAPSDLALLRKGLVARFGPLPNAPPEGEDLEEEPETPVMDRRSPGAVVAEMLRARPITDGPIDPEVAAALRE